MNILIVEDDLLIAEMLKRMLVKLNHQVCEICLNYNEAITYIQLNKGIDLVFLDINLNDVKNGINLGGELNSTYLIPFIYLTSYSDPKTIHLASKTLPQSYLTKPFTEVMLLSTLEIVSQRLRTKPKSIIIKDGSKQIKLLSENIYYVKKDANYIEIITKHKRFVVRQSIENFIENLDDFDFVRTHRSYAVKVGNIDQIKNQDIYINSEIIPLSRQFKEYVYKVFNNLN